MERDYYADAEAVSERLRTLGATDWADRLMRAIEDGFTATEILMALRHNLGDLLATGPQLDDDLRGFVVSLHADIDSALA